MINNKRIFITGGAGFIGTKLCALLHQNNEIMIFDNYSRNSIQYTNLEMEKNVTVVKGDILNIEQLGIPIMKFNPQIIIHMAAIAGIDTVIKSPIHTMEVNMIGTYNLLKVLEPILDGIECFLDFSTSEVFGSFAYKSKEKDTTNLAPVGEARWTYQVSKIAAEHLVHSYYKEKGLPIVSIRPFNIYGPGQVGEGAVHNFIVKALKGETIQIHGEGDQIRAWCYIDDFIDGIMLCLTKSEAIGHSFNIGNSRSTVTINMLAEMVVLLSGSTSEIKHIPKTYADVELRIPNISKAREILGYGPKVDLREGLMNTIKWYRGVGEDKIHD